MKKLSADKKLTHYQRSRLRVLAHLGRKCKYCGFSDQRSLQIDHVRGGGVREHKTMHCMDFHRKVLADRTGAYQLLCANCNWIKRYENNECARKGKAARAEWLQPTPAVIVDNMAKVQYVLERKQAIARLHALTATME